MVIAIFDWLIMQISNFAPVSMTIFALMGNEKAVTAMAEYIEREAALALVRPDAPEDEKAAVTIATAKKLVRDIVCRTPAADVATVVRCKDCKHHYDCGIHFCDRLGMDCPDDSDFFCSYGERKDGGVE